MTLNAAMSPVQATGGMVIKNRERSILMKRIIITLSAVLTAALFCFSLAADDLDGKAIAQAAYDVKDPNYSHTLSQMDLIEKDGTTESRLVETWGQHKNDLASEVMVFLNPASVKDTRFLLKENDGRDDDKWIYLPALRSTRRIAASEGSKSFMGTDATYDDLSTREVDEDTHERMDDIAKNGFDCYQVKSTPKDANDSQYKYRISCIDKATLLPVYVEMYDKKGALLKVLTVEKISNISGYNIPMSSITKNVQTGHSTRLIVKKIELDKAVSEKVFTAAFLNTGRL